MAKMIEIEQARYDELLEAERFMLGHVHMEDEMRLTQANMETLTKRYETAMLALREQGMELKHD